jgi:hypothetical protein
MIPIQEPTDNGITYDLKGKYYDDFIGQVFEGNTGGWIYPANISLFGLLSQYSYFMKILYSSGLADESWGRLNFQKGTEQYTVFVPSDSAFSAWAFKKYGFYDSPNSQAFVDSLLTYITPTELRRIASYHLIRGHMIFTDGKKSSGNYETLALSDKSTLYNVVYEKLNLNLQPDHIGISNEGGTPLASLNFPDISINPDEVTLSIFRSDYNKMASYIIDVRESSPYNYVTIGSVHNIDKVLEPE